MKGNQNPLFPQAWFQTWYNLITLNFISNLNHDQEVET